jgi:Papain family cysteine protease
MFGGKDMTGDQLSGALKPIAPARAPRVAFTVGGREERVDLRAKFGPVVDQAGLNSCSSCATVAAVEYLLSVREKQWLPLSSLFVYYNARMLSGNPTRNIPIFASHSPAALLAWGVCDEGAWPYVQERFDQEPPVDAYKRATVIEVVQYARLGTTEEIKVSLSQGIPAMFGSDIPRGYYDEARKTGRMPELGKAGGPPSGHAMLIVGYDDRDKAWLVRNSHGADFGEKGYVRIPYSVFDKHVWDQDVWAIGALEQLGQRKLIDGTVREAVDDVRRNGAALTASALKDLRKELREDFDKRLETSKQSIRERLREQEKQLEARRNKGGDGGNNGGGNQQR